MIQQLAITDLTRMSAGHVCVAGYDNAGAAVRLSTPRVHQVALAAHDGSPVIFPSAVIECDLLERQPAPPHTEDYRFAAATVRFVRRLALAEWRKLLDRTVFDSVQRIFEQPIVNDSGRYVLDGQGPRSIGTLRPRGIAKVTYTQDPEGSWSYRLGFYDQAGEFYRLKIVDMTWHRFWEQQRGADRTPAWLADSMTSLLKAKAHTVYLRIGLSRGWVKFPGRCYLQITGVHTLPDYLNGKTVLDLGNRLD